MVDDDLLQGLSRPGLIHPDVHQIQGIDDEHFFQIPGLLVDGGDQGFRRLEQVEDILFRKQHIQPGKDGKQLGDFLPVIDQPDADIVLPVGQPFDHPGHAVRGQLGNDRRPFLQALLNPWNHGHVQQRGR